MGLQGDQHMSRGDVMRRLRESDRDRDSMKTARRLENASIHRGGIRIADEGSIRSTNFDGDPADVTGDPGENGWVLGPSGLVAHNGVFRGEVRSANFEAGVSGYRLLPTGDAELNDAFIRGDITAANIESSNFDEGVSGYKLTEDGAATFSGTVKVAGGELEVNDAGEVRWLDDQGNVRLKIAQSAEDGIDTVKLIVFDEAGNDRVTMGEVAEGGEVHHGVVVKNAAGDSVAVLTTPTATSGQGFTYASNQSALAISSDELLISRPGATNDTLIRITEADGIRMAVDTDSDGIQSGQVTAGAADSAGTGFRTLRIPN